MLNQIPLTQSELEQLIKKCNDKYGPMNRDYLERSLNVVYGMLSTYPRVYALRIDLRFAIESPPDDVDTLICLQRSDPSAITRFMESLKSQLKADHVRQKRRGEPALPAFIWCREQDTSPSPHYHVVLLFNKGVYGYLGNYLDYDADNMGIRIQKAWCSALALPFPDYSSLVNFPENLEYTLFRQAAILRDDNYLSFLFRMAYLSKQKTKVINDGRRSFGCSQG